MANFLELSGEHLEEAGHQMFQKMGLTSIYPLNDARLLDIDLGGPYGVGEHLEFDYLIPYNECCLIGEITARTNVRRVRDKYRSFLNHINIIRNANINNKLWRTLGVPNNEIRSVRNVRYFRGFFITNQFEEYDLDLENIPSIGRFYRSDCVILNEYANCIGSYSKNHFLSIFDIPEERGHRPLEVNLETHNLIVSTDKHIVSGDVPRANIYTFEINPYDILEFAHVYRRDELPCLASEEDENFQRPLIPNKISQIRRKLLTNPDFMFPNSILAVLSNDCRYDRDSNSLIIPQTYHSISIIDGQHRLFSYADTTVRERMDETCRIIITAILFEGAGAEEIRSYSAKAFVEINRNQTGIQRKHLDAIAYDILGETDSRALAAKILFEANKRRGQSLHGLFETNKRLTGKLKATTIISALRPLTNVNNFGRLVRVREGSSNYLLRQGYLNLFDVNNIENLSDAEILIHRGIVCIEHYFNLVSKVFQHDWPELGIRKNSSFEYAKVISGFVRLLRQFVSEGATWNIIRRELRTIRSNIMQLRQINDYEGVLFDPSHPAIPDSNPRDTEDFQFLNENRHIPTSIENIVHERHH